jgi:putative transposase
MTLAVPDSLADDQDGLIEVGCASETQCIESGIRVGQRRIGRLMHQDGIQVIRCRKFKRTTGSDRAFNIAPNLLQQDFTASGLNQKWASDLPYIWTR